GRIESSWPNLTKVGPSSSRISLRGRARAYNDISGSWAPRGRISHAYPKPCRAATCAISRTRAIWVRREGCVSMGQWYRRVVAASAPSGFGDRPAHDQGLEQRRVELAVARVGADVERVERLGGETEGGRGPGHAPATP